MNLCAWFPVACATLLSACEPSVVIGRRGASDCATPFVADQVAVAELHGCALVSGTIYCWGEGSAGQLGNDDTVAHPSPVPIASADTFDDVAVSGYGACGRRIDGTLFCWGENFAGGLANGGSQNSAAPVETIGGVAEVSAGPGYVLTRDASGMLTTWGSNEYGQLGLGPSTVGMAVRTETPIPGSAFASLSAGDHHACVLDDAGHAFCAGDNVNGQLAMASSAGFDTFTAVAPSLTFEHIESGFDRTCGITPAGALYCWGRNFPTWIPSPQGVVITPTRIGTDSDYTDVSIGFSHACALHAGGKLFCWGSNDDTELGYEGAASETPVEVTPGTRYAQISSGWGYNCALRASDSAVVCWGRNGGRLGRGADESTSPKAICLP